MEPKSIIASVSEVSEKVSIETENKGTDCINVSSPRNDSGDHISDSSEAFESEKSSTVAPRMSRRPSLWKLFDPLHSVCPQNTNSESCNSVLVDRNKTTALTESNDLVSGKEILIRNTTTSVPSDDTLISFESPKKLAKPLIPKHLFFNSMKCFKIYTEKDFLQALKNQELLLVSEFSKNYSEYEIRFTEKDIKFDHELTKIVKANKSQIMIISEMLKIAENISDHNSNIETKLEATAVENEERKSDIKTSKEDLGDLERAFSDLCKRYEQSKSMIKIYKENEEHIMKNTDSLQLALDEQNSMNDILESRTQEVTDKVEKEIESAKKSTETQTAILEAQLKKAQMKVCSLENDLKQTRSENDKLSNIYDDLVSKFNG